MTEDDELNESIYSAESGYRIDDIIGDLARRRIMRIVGVRERVDRSGTCTTAQHHPNKRRSSLCHVVQRPNDPRRRMARRLHQQEA